MPNSFYYIRFLGMLYLTQNPSHPPTNFGGTSPPSTPPITPSLLPLPNPPEQTRNFKHTAPPLAQHPTFPITPRRSAPSHHRRPLHRPPVSNTQHTLLPPSGLCPGARWPVVERHGWGIRRERRARARARAQTQTSGGRRRLLSRR